ncbi:hypothetical protein PMIN06_009006 [Paraphaeosphaeria minitans]
MYASTNERSIVHSRGSCICILFFCVWTFFHLIKLSRYVGWPVMSTDSANIGWRLQLFTGFFTPLQVIAVGLRFYARWLVVGQSHPLEDALVVVALVSQLILGAVGLASVTFAGVGQHLAYLEEHEPEKVLNWGRYLLALATLYFVDVNIPKLAVLALYRRLFPQRTARITVYIIGGILITGSIVNTIVSLAACEPFEANFNPTLIGAKCIDKEAFYVWTSVPNIVTDVVMLALPLPIVWSLHNTKRIKVALTFTFLVGSLGLVASILRFHTFFVTNSFTDGTYDAVELIIWTVAEPGIYLISACLLTYRPLLERVGKSRLFGSFRTSVKSSNPSVYGPGNRDGPVDGGGVPLRNVKRKGNGFTEIDDDGSSGNVYILRASSERNIPGSPVSGPGGITVTTEIQNSWAPK